MLSPLAPASVQLNLANGECNANAEINFELTGFRVSGLVSAHPQCASGAQPQAGETAQLFNAANEVVSTTTTRADGSFSFENILPGSYSLRVAGTVVPISVLGSNLEIRPHIHVSGYELSGSISDASSKAALNGFDVVLYSHASSNLECADFDASKYANHESWGMPVCVASTDAKGRFSFPVVPCGSYVIAPSASASGDADAFSFKATHQQVTVDVAPVTLPASFALTGVSVSGKVINAKSKPVADAQVTLSPVSGSSFTTTTNAEGAYAFKSAPLGKYTVKVEKQGFHFDKTTVDVSSAARSVPDIVVSKIDVCGKVSIPYPPAGVSGGARRRVSLTNADGSGTKHTVAADESGAYCFQLSADSRSREVVLSLQVTPYERDAGLILTAFENSVSVDTLPVQNVHFTQSLLSLRGRVQCLGQTCGDEQIKLQLTPVSHEGPVATATAQRASAQDTFASFEFPLLIPGRYAVKTLKSNWCWQEETVEVELKESNYDGLELVQVGYSARISSTHDVELQYQVPGSSGVPNSIKVKGDAKNAQSFCLPAAGEYSFRAVSVLYQFDKDVYTYNTKSSDSSIELVAKRVKINGQIIIDASTAATHLTTAQVEVVARGSGSDSPKASQPIEFTHETQLAGNGGVALEYSVWAAIGDELKISASSKGGVLLYYPTTVTVKVASLSTGITVPAISARPGLFISGSVFPALPNVVVNILDESDDSVVLGNIATDYYGAYKAGPLLDTASYRVVASAPGFHLVQQQDESSTDSDKSTRTVNFRASKLGSLTVRAITGSKGSEDAAGTVIAGALLSLSGAGGYRANNATNEQGEVVFSNIFPGDYYLMPLLKEYTFAKDAQPALIPKHQQPIAVTVKEGADNLLLIGSRIAYSCFGRVSSLNGQPERGVTVEARSIVSGESAQSGQQLEKATTDNQGQYRLRGLIPGQSYNIHLSTGETAHIERTSPEAYASTLVATADLRDYDFLAFRKSAQRFEVFGRVLTNTSLLQYVTVQLFEDDSATAEPVRETKLFHGVNFYTFAGLPKTHYSIKVKVDPALNRAFPNTISQAQLESASAKIAFTADSPSQNVDLSLESLSTETIVEVPQGQLFATLLVIAGAFGLYHRKRITKFVKTRQQAAAAASSDNKPGKKAKRVPVEDQFVANLQKYGRG